MIIGPVKSHVPYNYVKMRLLLSVVVFFSFHFYVFKVSIYTVYCTKYIYIYIYKLYCEPFLCLPFSYSMVAINE